MANRLKAEDAPETLILSVRLLSGKFESELRVPLLGCSAEQQKRTVEQWLDLIMTGFRIGATHIDAVLDDGRRALKGAEG